MTGLAPRLVRARELQETLMVDACGIRRATGNHAVNGFTATKETVAVVETICRIAPANFMKAEAAQIAGITRGLVVYLASIPAHIDTVKKGDQLTVTKTTDPTIAGQVFTVEFVEASTWLTARRLHLSIEH